MKLLDYKLILSRYCVSCNREYTASLSFTNYITEEDFELLSKYCGVCSIDVIRQRHKK